MCKKLIVLVCLLAITSSAWAGGGLWHNFGTDSLWSTPANWQGGAAPSSAEAGYITYDWCPWGEPVIDDGIAAVASQVIVGWAAFGEGDVTLNVDGGSLTTPDLWLGLDGTLANHGILDMTDGTVTVSSTLAIGFNTGKGTINMSGGTINVTGNLALPNAGGYGAINLYDGLIDITGGFIPTDGSYHIEIQEGTMKIAGDYEALVYYWASQGWWTGYGDPAKIVASYDAGSNVTTVTPEPATMVLLSLGGMALLRRKRNS